VLKEPQVLRELHKTLSGPKEVKGLKEE